MLLVPSFAPKGFSLGIPVFPSPQKPTFPNSNSARNQVDKELLLGCATSKSLFDSKFAKQVRDYFNKQFIPEELLNCSIPLTYLPI